MNHLISTTSASAALMTGLPLPAGATGRATLELASSKYVPRIKDGAKAYKKDVYKAVGSGNLEALAAAVAEPRKKTKEDKAKADAGFAERAASAGPFSDARVLAAMDLYAAAFSDRAESNKTKAMKKEVATLRSIVGEWRALSAGGGKGSKGGATRAKELYKEGGDTFNRYVYTANLGLNIKFEKLDYL